MRKTWLTQPLCNWSACCHIFQLLAPIRCGGGFGVYFGAQRGFVFCMGGACWQRGSTGAERYGCIPRSAHGVPTECGEQLGRDPSKNGSSKSLVSKSFFLGREHFGTRRPHSLGYACTLYAPTRVHARGVVLCERTCFCLLSTFYETLPSMKHFLLRTLSLLKTLAGAF